MVMQGMQEEKEDEYMNSKAIFWVFLMVFLFVSGNYMNTVAHEETHAKIDQYLGGQNISIHYEYLGLLGAYETAQYPNGVNRELIYSLHSINEIVGYQYSALFAMFLIVVGFLGYVILSREKCPNCGFQ